MKKCLIMGGFKTGTHTLYELISKNTKYEVFRSHFDPEVLKKNYYDYIVLSFRNDKDFTESEFFNNILDENYNYSPFNKSNFLHKFSNYEEETKKKIILSLDVEVILDFYKRNIDILLQDHNNNKYIKLASNWLNIPIKDVIENIQEFEIKSLFSKNMNQKLICVRTEKLHCLNYQNQILKFIDCEEHNQELVEGNMAKNKWYHEKYKIFKYNLK